MASKKLATYQTHSDEQLMKLVQEKDAYAFESLYDRYSALMYTYFHRMLWKDKEKARDFTQELFSKLFEKSNYFQEGRNFKTWFYSVAHNMCKNEYAKHEVRVDAHAEIKYQTVDRTPESSSETLDKKSFKAELEEVLQSLDEVKRTTFELRFYQDMSIQEISESMECSEGTVKSRLFYTIKELNSKLKDFEHILKAILIMISFYS